MKRDTPAVHSHIRSLATATRRQLIGSPLSAVLTLALAAIVGAGTARYVALTDRYLAIQYAIPTYDGRMGPLFFAGATVLLTLAVTSAVLRAGVLPTLTLTGAPVVGWAVNHFGSTLTPHYALTFPVEMAILYGGFFGIIGYVLGTGLRRAMGPIHPTPL